MATSITETLPQDDIIAAACASRFLSSPTQLMEPVTAFFSDWTVENPTVSEAYGENQLYFSMILKALNSTSKAEISVYSEKIDALIEEVKGLKRNESILVKINILKTKLLRQPLDALVEVDGDGFIARTIDFDLFGYGEDRIEAIDALKHEIESLYFDLIEDDNFTEEWRGIKAFLKQQIVDC